MSRPIKLFAAFFGGNIAFIFLYATVCWFTARLGITPYGRFMQEFFSGRSTEQAREYIDANKVLFDLMMPEAAHFSNMVLTPTVGVIMGLVIGLIVSARDRTTALWWSFVSVMPVTAVFWFWMAGDEHRAQYLIFLVAAVMAGAFIGNEVSLRTPSGRRA